MAASPEEPRRRRRIGVFGGTFNPIHYGHLRVADAVRRRLALDELRLVPAARPPHKLGDGSVAAADDRLEMARLAVAEFPGLTVSDVELRRGGPSFTVDTLAEIRLSEGPDADLFFLVGADTLPEIPSWREAARLADLAELVVVNRPGRAIRVTDELARTFGAERARRLVERAIEVPPEPASATAIRDRVRRGLSLDEWVPESVARYIRKKNLFRDDVAKDEPRGSS